MRRTVLFLICLSVFVGVFSQDLNAGPSFCHGLDCPQYNVTVKDPANNYEQRLYFPAKWVRANITSASFNEANDEGFNVLFDYIQGANVAKEKIKMTAPVTTKVTLPTTIRKTTFVVSFFVPFAHQTDAPKPTAPNLYLADQPKVEFAVATFSGYVRSFDDAKPYIANLTDQLVQRKLNYEQDFVVVAQYDGPYRPIARHNEVWIKILN